MLTGLSGYNFLNKIPVFVLALTSYCVPIVSLRLLSVISEIELVGDQIDVEKDGEMLMLYREVIIGIG
jgi:hypothetical protein